MRQFDYNSANQWLAENWQAIKANQYINCIKYCIEKEKAAGGHQQQSKTL